MVRRMRTPAAVTYRLSQITLFSHVRVQLRMRRSLPVKSLRERRRSRVPLEDHPRGVDMPNYRRRVYPYLDLLTDLQLQCKPAEVYERLVVRYSGQATAERCPRGVCNNTLRFRIHVCLIGCAHP